MATNENNFCTCTTPEYTIILNQQGPSGRQGATGQNGFSPVINVATNNASTYTLTITTADGVITTPNLKSPLPTGGSEGQVLTNYGNNVYAWGSLPNSTPQAGGIIRIATGEDFIPDDEGELDDTTAVTPQRMNTFTKDFLKASNIIAGDNISISTSGNNITINSTTSTDGLVKFVTLTAQEYADLPNKNSTTMYITTDTNKVYLGTIELTGGATAQYKTLLINNYDNATQTNLGGSTIVQVKDTEV